MTSYSFNPDTKIANIPTVSNSIATRNTALIKAEAKRLGFLSCEISKAEFLDEEAPRQESWLDNNMHGKMKYIENHFDKRLDPTNYFIF